MNRSVVDQVAYQLETPRFRIAARDDGPVIGKRAGAQSQGSQTRNRSRSGIGEVGVIGDDVRINTSLYGAGVAGNIGKHQFGPV